MSDLDPCEDCPYYDKAIEYRKDGTVHFVEICKNDKPCPYISLDTIQ